MKIEIWEEKFKFAWKREKKKSKRNAMREAGFYLYQLRRDILGITIEY